MARNIPIYMRVTLEEAEAMRRAQKEDNQLRRQQDKAQKLGDWCAGLIREHLQFRSRLENAESGVILRMSPFAARLEGEAGHGAPGDLATAAGHSALETPSRPLRSWGEVKDPTERMQLAAKWNDKVPMPLEFKGLSNEVKIAWLDRNWPLEG